MSSNERFDSRYHLSDLHAELRTAHFPGIELDFCVGTGTFMSPYEFDWKLPTEMATTPRQLGDLAQALVDTIGNSNFDFYLRANGITFRINLLDMDLTESFTTDGDPETVFSTPLQRQRFEESVNSILKT